MLRALILTTLSLAVASPAAAQAGPTRAVEMTFLRSHDEDPARLVAFIEANWFALDAEAVRQGLMTRYDLAARKADADTPWNVVVTVGYPDPAGYDAIKAPFEAIRGRHVPVAIEGKTRLSDFGRIVSSVRLAPGAGGPPPR